MKSLFSLLTLLLVLTGCLAGTRKTSEIPEDALIIQGVPFYEDTNYQCGPSSLAAVINYWKEKTGSSAAVTPDAVSSEVFSKNARGTLGMDMAFYAQKSGFQTSQYSGSFDDLRSNVLRGTPPVILVDHGALFYQRNHFLVVTGYSSDGIIVHSGLDEKFIPLKELNEIWGKTDFWTLVIRPSP